MYILYRIVDPSSCRRRKAAKITRKATKGWKKRKKKKKEQANKQTTIAKAPHYSEGNGHYKQNVLVKEMCSVGKRNFLNHSSRWEYVTVEINYFSCFQRVH